MLPQNLSELSSLQLSEAGSLGIRNIAKEEIEFLRRLKTALHTHCAKQTNKISRVGVKVTQSVNGRKALVGERKGHSEQIRKLS